MGIEDQQTCEARGGVQVVRSLQKVALKNRLVDIIKGNFELWESDKMPLEEILRRLKDQARAKKLRQHAQKGRWSIRLGMNQANGHRPGQEYETWGGVREPTTRWRRITPRIQ